MEKEELEQLRQTNDELERRLRLLNDSKEAKQKELQIEVKKDYEDDYQNTSQVDTSRIVTEGTWAQHDTVKTVAYAIEQVTQNGATWDDLNDQQQKEIKEYDRDLYEALTGGKIWDKLSKEQKESIERYDKELYDALSNGITWDELSDEQKRQLNLIMKIYIMNCLNTKILAQWMIGLGDRFLMLITIKLYRKKKN